MTIIVEVIKFIRNNYQDCSDENLQHRSSVKHHNNYSGSEDHRVLVHCVQGLSRSCSVIAAYFIEYQRSQVDAAINRMRGKHSGCLNPCRFYPVLKRLWEIVNNEK